MSSEVEETLRRIQSRGPGAPARLIPLGRGRSECPSSKGYPRHKGVKGVLVVSANGTPIRSNLESEQTTTYAALLSQLAMKASSVVRTLDETDELTFFRIRSLKHEIMIAPDKEYLLIVIQRPADS